MSKKTPIKELEEKKGLKEEEIDKLKKIVNMKKQKSISNELDELIYGQEKRKKEREDKTKTPSPLEFYFSTHPEKFDDMSLDELIKLSMLSSSKNIRELGEKLSIMRTNEEKNRIAYLEKRIETIERGLENKIAFLEKLILEKL